MSSLQHLTIFQLEAEKHSLIVKHEQEMMIREEARLKCLVHAAVMTESMGPTMVDSATDSLESEVASANELELIRTQEAMAELKLENAQGRQRISELEDEIAMVRTESMSSLVMPDTTSMSTQLQVGV